MPSSGEPAGGSRHDFIGVGERHVPAERFGPEGSQPRWIAAVEAHVLQSQGHRVTLWF